MKGGGGGADLFDDAAAMDPDFSRSEGDQNFEFAFNSRNFSDRVLRIEIVAGPPECKSDDGEGCGTLADWARHRKRRREGFMKEKGAVKIALYNSEQIASCDQPDTEGVASEHRGGEAVAMIEGSPSDDEPSHSSDSWSMDSSSVLRVKPIYISSAILAAKSPFFYKLFSNGMRESDQRQATLRINASEEVALMELLSFMYSGKLATTSTPLLLDVLMAADKFEVASCMRYCSQMLRNLTMNTESALLFLDLPSSVSMASAVQPLTDAAKEYLAKKYKDITKFEEEVMSLPLAGVEAILSSDELQVESEDAAYDFMLNWARAQYPMLEERREVLGSRLCRLIRFPFMTCWKLSRVLTCTDLGNELVYKAVLNALFFKADTQHRQRALALEGSTSRRFVERAYKYRPVKIFEFEAPHPQCVVYLDLKREECVSLFPSGRVQSQAFLLRGQVFFLSAHCNMDQQNSPHSFGLFLGMKGAVSFTVDYEFAVRSSPTDEFVSKCKGKYT